MEKRLDKIDIKLDKIIDKIDGHAQRVTILETKQRGFITILGVLGASIVSAIGVILKKLPLF